MNKSKNSSTNSTEFFLTIEQYYQLIDYNTIIQTLTIYSLTIINGLGILLNILSFFILKNDRFKSTPIFGYLKIYSLNSSIISLLILINVLTSTYNYFDISYKYEANFFNCYVLNALLTTAHIYSAVLDIYISLDRLFNFFTSLNKFKKLSYKTVCFILFIVCLVINCPIFLMFEPTMLPVNLDGKTITIIYIFGTSKFGKSEIGEILSFLIYFIRDVVTLVLEVVLNLVSVALLKKRVSMKQSFKKSNSSFNSLSVVESSKKFLNRVNKNLTLMVFAMCILSALMHISFIGCVFMYTLKVSNSTSGVCFLSRFTMSMKHFSNFFFFLIFNTLFMEQFKNKFNLLRGIDTLKIN